MPQYRAYVIGSDNLVATTADYKFENDDLAIGSIMRLYPRETVELWSGTRRVAKIVAGVAVPNSAESSSDAESETLQRRQPA